MSTVESVIQRLKEIKGKGNLILELPLEGSCFYCGRKTKCILNYFVQNDTFGIIVFSSIKKNIKNSHLYRYPISICNEKCLKKEIDQVLGSILEKMTE